MIQKDWGIWGGGPQMGVRSFSFEVGSDAVEFCKSKISPEFQDHMLKVLELPE